MTTTVGDGHFLPIESRNPLTIAPSAQPGFSRDAVTSQLTGSRPATYSVLVAVTSGTVNGVRY